MGENSMSEDEAATKLAVREAVCAEGWKRARAQNSRTSRPCASCTPARTNCLATLARP